MDNGIETKKGRTIAHVTASAITLALSLVAFALFAYMAVEFFMSIPLQGSGESISEQLGIGLTIGFSIVFMIIFGGAEIIVSVFAIPLHISVVKYRDGGARRYGIVALLTNSSIVIISIVTFIVVLIMNGAAS